MSDKSRYTLRVDSDQLDTWEETVENSEEYASIRHLITLAVTRELSDAYILRDDVEGLNVGLDESFTSDIEEIRTTVSLMEDKLDNLKLSRNSDPELADLAASMHSHLPQVTPENLDGWWEISPHNSPTITLEEAVRAYGRIDDMVSYMDENEWLVRKAAAKLDYEFDNVRMGTDAEGFTRIVQVTDSDE